jgi:hypothetical protein
MNVKPNRAQTSVSVAALVADAAHHVEGVAAVAAEVDQQREAADQREREDRRRRAVGDPERRCRGRGDGEHPRQLGAW